MAQRPKRERRRGDARFLLIERRDRGSLWKYGSVALCIGLWGILSRLLMH